jgi:hypothetical protein
MKPGIRRTEPGIAGELMLNDVQIRKAKAADRPYKLADGGGLHVHVSPAGGVVAPANEFEGREKMLSLGPYLSVGLAEARDAAADAGLVARAWRTGSRSSLDRGRMR